MLEVRLAVTQPYHGPDGALVHDVGELLAPGDVPDGVRTTPVVVEGRPAAKTVPAKPAASNAKSTGGA